ncbi:MAG: glycosyltransferase family 4 protein [Pseudomonadota bacterium]
MTADPPLARFAIPGDLQSPTGGYAYDRRILEGAAAVGVDLRHVPLPAGFPWPSAEELRVAEATLSEGAGPLLIDGLACGALPAEMLARLPGPVIALCHHPIGLETGLDPCRAAEALRREAAALAEVAHVVVTSAPTAATLERDLGVQASRISVAPPGLSPAPEARRGNRPPLILSVGSLTPRKGHDLLIAALALIADLDWQAEIIGPARDAGWAEGIYAQAADLGDRVSFRGTADDTEVAAAYLRADLFCLPSRYEGYGMVFAEAMMRGLPVVALKTEAAEALVPATAGMLIEGEDAAALGTALRTLLSDPDAATGAARAARAHALTLPSWEETTMRIADVLRRLA